MKTCSTCKVEKPESEFHKHRRNKDGLNYTCKNCANARTQQWRLNNPGRARVDQLRYKFDMAPSDYQKLLDSQGGGCAICGRVGPDAENRSLSVDHNHLTGKVRGLLCGHCNRALGMLQESPKLLRAAADYIERHET